MVKEQKNKDEYEKTVLRRKGYLSELQIAVNEGEGEWKEERNKVLEDKKKVESAYQGSIKPAAQNHDNNDDDNIYDIANIDNIIN